MSSEYRRLYRSAEDSTIAGVCGGLGSYLKFDPVLVRLLWVAITFMTGLVPGVLAYLVAWIIVPREPLPVTLHHRPSENPNTGAV